MHRPEEPTSIRDKDHTQTSDTHNSGTDQWQQEFFTKPKHKSSINIILAQISSNKYSLQKPDTNQRP